MNAPRCDTNLAHFAGQTLTYDAAKDKHLSKEYRRYALAHPFLSPGTFFHSLTCFSKVAQPIFTLVTK
jgi:hypothetical protein